MTKRKRRSYTDEFKLEAVWLVKEYRAAIPTNLPAIRVWPWPNAGSTSALCSRRSHGDDDDIHQSMPAVARMTRIGQRLEILNKTTQRNRHVSHQSVLLALGATPVRPASRKEEI